MKQKVIYLVVLLSVNVYSCVLCEDECCAVSVWSNEMDVVFILCIAECNVFNNIKKIIMLMLVITPSFHLSRNERIYCMTWSFHCRCLHITNKDIIPEIHVLPEIYKSTMPRYTPCGKWIPKNSSTSVFSQTHYIIVFTNQRSRRFYLPME